MTPKKGIFKFWSKNHKQNFSSYLKIIDAQMLFWSVFLKTHKKTIIYRQKRPKWRFWQAITFYLCVFKNTDQKNICVFIVFKAESKPKQEEKNFVGGFPLKTKNALFWWSKMVLFVSQVSNLYFSRLFFNVKGSSLPIFTKKY